ncbi:hypothetical protein [uncultured Streptococcus sp.]
MYSFTVNYAKKIGCYTLTLHVWNDYEGALHYYQR